MKTSVSSALRKKLSPTELSQGWSAPSLVAKTS